MPVNRDKPTNWAADTARSVAEYNEWFMKFAPTTFRRVRRECQVTVAKAFQDTNELRSVGGTVLRAHPELLPVLRMCMAPPIAVDRLVGLSDTVKSLVSAMEEGKKPARVSDKGWVQQTEAIAGIIGRLLDHDLFPWLQSGNKATTTELAGAIAVVADRLCTAVANPEIRNAQEQRQLDLLEAWLKQRGYSAVRPPSNLKGMAPATYGFRANVLGGVGGNVTVTIDAVIQPRTLRPSGLPLLVEAKSAGDFTNVNKRRKEESDKMTKLRAAYGNDVEYMLLLGGYFDSNYLGYEAEAGIDFIWEHRLDDFTLAGL